MELRPGRFSIDESPTFAGYTTGQTWNGWACPYFTAEEAHKLVDYWNHGFTATTHAHYEAATDTFVFADDNVDDADACQGELHTVDGQPIRLYPIGNSCWCWDEDDPHFDPDWCDYVVRLDETTGAVLETWKGEAWHDDHTGTTQWRVSMAHGADDAGHRALAMRQQLAHVRKGDA